MPRMILITEKQFNKLFETDYNFHIGKDFDGKPYKSDTKYIMRGRDTGMFGSGTYFSTYKTENGKFQKNYGDDFSMNPNFIQVGQNIWRVDLDFYKNLYRVTSKRQGDVLYTLLYNLNKMANNISPNGEFDSKGADYNNSISYQICRRNANSLGLKLPTYGKLVRMMQEFGRNEKPQSFPTVFMELNGFNGVNVSGIDYYDNTTHGSVVYDLNKVDGKVEQASPKDMIFADGNAYNNTVVNNFTNDKEITAIMGMEHMFADELNTVPIPKAMRMIKNYINSGHELSDYAVKRLSPILKKRYLTLLNNKNSQSI